MSPSPPIRPLRSADANWLQSRVATLNDLRREDRSEQIRSLAVDLTESARAMDCAEVEAAARAVARLVGNPGALAAAIEILRRIVKRAVRNARSDAMSSIGEFLGAAMFLAIAGTTEQTYRTPSDGSFTKFRELRPLKILGVA